MTDSDSDSEDSEQRRQTEIRRMQKGEEKRKGVQSLSILTVNEEDGIGFFPINVKYKNKTYVVLKRYSEFRDLNRALRPKYRSQLPSLPKKKLKLFTKHKDSNFLEKRRAMLDNYVRKILLINHVSECEELVSWVSEDSKDLTREFVYETIPTFPKTQEVTDITIPKYRKMSDHILYTLEVSNRNTGANWIVLKRFTQFHMMDECVRADLSNQNVVLPERPHRKSKAWIDHMSPWFIERRRVLLQNYLRKLLLVPEVSHNEHFLVFLGVGNETAI